MGHAPEQQDGAFPGGALRHGRQPTQMLLTQYPAAEQRVRLGVPRHGVAVLHLERGAVQVHYSLLAAEPVAHRVGVVHHDPEQASGAVKLLLVQSFCGQLGAGPQLLYRVLARPVQRHHGASLLEEPEHLPVAALLDASAVDRLIRLGVHPPPALHALHHYVPRQVREHHHVHLLPEPSGPHVLGVKVHVSAVVLLQHHPEPPLIRVGQVRPVDAHRRLNQVKTVLRRPVEPVEVDTQLLGQLMDERPAALHDEGPRLQRNIVQLNVVHTPAYAVPGVEKPVHRLVRVVGDGGEGIVFLASSMNRALGHGRLINGFELSLERRVHLRHLDAQLEAQRVGGHVVGHLRRRLRALPEIRVDLVLQQRLAEVAVCLSVQDHVAARRVLDAVRRERLLRLMDLHVAHPEDPDELLDGPRVTLS